jgi:hypothetical protein
MAKPDPSHSERLERGGRWFWEFVSPVPGGHALIMARLFVKSSLKARRVDLGQLGRVRRIGNRHVQIIKANGNAAPFERDE